MSLLDQFVLARYTSPDYSARCSVWTAIAIILGCVGIALTAVWW